MTVLIGFLADSHVAERPSRTNYLTLLNRHFWKNIDTKSGHEELTVYKPASHDNRTLLAAADFLKTISGELDMLVLLGDLATTGKPEDLAAAKLTFGETGAVRHVNNKLQSSFASIRVPIHFVPGNHDRYKDDIGTPGGRLFDKVFESEYRPVNSVCSATVSSGEVEVGIFSADFCYNENEPVSILKQHGCGRASPIVLGELDRQTSMWQSRNLGKPVIWAIHFSPADYTRKSIELDNREEVLRLARKLNVRHIFCGHTHERRHEIGSHPHIYNAGSVSSIECRNKHFLHLCQIQKKGLKYILDVADFLYDEDEDEFLPDVPSNRA